MASFHNWTGDEEIDTQVPQFLNEDNKATQEKLDTKLSKTDTAAAALKDGAGNTISTTYAKKADISGMVKSVNGKEPDAGGNVNVANMTGASDSAAGKAGLVPAPAAGMQNKFLCADATWKDAGGLPVGHEFFTTNPNIPVGCIPLLGGEYSRTAYADLWAWVQTQQGYLIEESAWQAKAAVNGGNVPFYSKGDGTTTFRVPSLKCWVKGANGIEEVGSYLSAGLPILPDMSHTHERGTMNITGKITYITAEDSNISNSEYPTTGAFRWLNESYTQKTPTTSGEGSRDLSFDASRSWTGETSSASLTRTTDIYGNSDTVQPKSIVGMWLVKAYGTVTNVGSTDVAAIAQGLTRVENKLNEAAIVGTVIPYAGTSLPNGYLPCNGAAVSRETYASLFAVIGTTYGSGDGSTTFTLPNLIDRFLEGSSSAGQYRDAGLPNIEGKALIRTGQFYYSETISGEQHGALKGVPQESGNVVWTYALNQVTNSSNYPLDSLYFDASQANAIYGASSTVQPPALTMRYIIKY